MSENFDPKTKAKDIANLAFQVLSDDSSHNYAEAKTHSNQLAKEVAQVWGQPDQKSQVINALKAVFEEEKDIGKQGNMIFDGIRQNEPSGMAIHYDPGLFYNDRYLNIRTLNNKVALDYYNTSRAEQSNIFSYGGGGANFYSVKEPAQYSVSEPIAMAQIVVAPRRFGQASAKDSAAMGIPGTFENDADHRKTVAKPPAAPEPTYAERLFQVWNFVRDVPAQAKALWK